MYVVIDYSFTTGRPHQPADPHLLRAFRPRQLGRECRPPLFRGEAAGEGKRILLSRPLERPVRVIIRVINSKKLRKAYNNPSFPQRKSPFGDGAATSQGLPPF